MTRIAKRDSSKGLRCRRLDGAVDGERSRYLSKRCVRLDDPVAAVDLSRKLSRW